MAAAPLTDPLVIIDGPPGIACPAIAASTGVDLALVVTEPTLAGLHDLRRALDMTGHFEVDRAVCINKHDLHAAGADAIERECAARGVDVLASIPFDEAVPAAMAVGRPVTDRFPASPAAAAMNVLWRSLRARLGVDGRGAPVTLKLPESPRRAENEAG